jgi:prophage DNA circulation protein
MFKPDVQEATPIVERTLMRMLSLITAHGRVGSDARTQIGDVLAHCELLLADDAIGEPLDECYTLSRLAGMTLPKFMAVREQTESETPVMAGAILIKNSMVQLCLAHEAMVLSKTVFHSRQDAEQAKLNMNAAFDPAQEIAADDMDATTYQVLVGLHAAVTQHLVETARPLPRMMKFRFYAPSLPTLLAAYKLYDDASRADDLRGENRVVHPLFMMRTGRALSA